MPSKSKPNQTHPHLNNQNPHKTYPPKSKDPYPMPKPQETKPANISCVRKAPDPGRLLTKDPHPFPVAVSFLRSLHVVPLAQAARLPPSPGLHFPPRPLASPFAPTPPPPLHPFPLPGALPRPASSLLLPPASAPPSPPSQTDQNSPLSPHTQNTPKMPLPATIHVLNVYE